MTRMNTILIALFAIFSLGLVAACDSDGGTSSRLGNNSNQSGDDEQDSNGDDEQDSDSDSDSDSVDRGSVADTVVGAWTGAGTANTSQGKVRFEWGWYLCSDMRMYGFSKIDSYKFLDKGSYTASESGKVVVTYRSKDTSIGDTWGPEKAYFDYDAGSDTLKMSSGVKLRRVAGSVSDSDCNPGW